MKFADILATLPAIDDITALALLDDNDTPLHQLDNKPGTAGSVRVYHALLQKHGKLHAEAAAEGLRLYAEHTDDARQFPGKHPNIDRLLAIAEQNAPALNIQIIAAVQ